MEFPRRGERRIDDLLLHPVSRQVEEANGLARRAHLGRHGLEPAGLASERRPEIDDGNGARGHLGIAHCHRLEDVHGTSEPATVISVFTELAMKQFSCAVWCMR